MRFKVVREYPAYEVNEYDLKELPDYWDTWDAQDKFDYLALNCDEDNQYVEATGPSTRLTVEEVD